LGGGQVVAGGERSTFAGEDRAGDGGVTPDEFERSP